MVYFLIPVFNEALNIEALAGNLVSVLKEDDIKFVFSDDGSTDGSPDMIKKFFPEGKTVVLGDGKNYGPGNAFNVGFEWILKESNNDNDIVLTIEADNTSDATIVPAMVQISRLGFNLVLASVYSQGGGFQKTSFLRKLLSACANTLMRLIFDLHVQTLSSFYRVYSVGLLRTVKAKYSTLIKEPGFLCMIEMLMKCIKVKANVIEVPTMLYSEKRKGKSKMKLMKTTFSYVRFMFSNKY
ncbi:MAG: glycosyltransferase family 2 protein [Bacteroidia bacterium]|nr:glycosyltransferase family 2 protein [Bacteroidia bacterium]